MAIFKQTDLNVWTYLAISSGGMTDSRIDLIERLSAEKKAAFFSLSFRESRVGVESADGRLKFLACNKSCGKRSEVEVVGKAQGSS